MPRPIRDGFGTIITESGIVSDYDAQLRWGCADCKKLNLETALRLKVEPCDD